MAETDTNSGNREMDGEHRVQLGLMTAFREAAGGGRGAAEADEILDQLLDYSKMHFMSEQLLMRLYEYADYESHQSHHDRMLEEMEAMRDSYRRGDGAFDGTTVDRLIKDMTAHISRTDEPLGQYLGSLDCRSG